MFFCEYPKIFKNTFFCRTTMVAAFVKKDIQNKKAYA